MSAGRDLARLAHRVVERRADLEDAADAGDADAVGLHQALHEDQAPGRAQQLRLALHPGAERRCGEVVDLQVDRRQEALGDITGDLASRRGMVSGTANGAPGTMMVRGQAPMAELLGYQSRLNALTSGQGRYTIEFSHYEAVPPNMQQQLVGAFGVRDDD